MHHNCSAPKFPMTPEGDVAHAKYKRELANTLLQRAQYDEAIMGYNDALDKVGNECHQEDSLSYANRAAVYLDLGFFEHCLHNLDLAEKHYPRDKIQKLQNRRQRCEILMKLTEDKAKTINPFADMFDKLSYKPNPKVPFFIDALKLNEDSIYGRHLITTQKLKAGDAIAALDDLIVMPNTRASTIICFFCLKSNNCDLQKNDIFVGAFFCSDVCEQNYAETCLHHDSEFAVKWFVRMSTDPDKERFGMTMLLFMRMLKHFGTVKAMKKFVNENSNEKPTVFDFDWSVKPSIADIFKIILGTARTDVRSLEILKRFKSLSGAILSVLQPDNVLTMILENETKYGNFIEKTLRKIFSATEVLQKFNVMVFQEKAAISTYFHPSMSLLNHSCDPNISMRVMNNGKVAWIVTRPIPANGQILINYTPEYYSFNQVSTSCLYRDTCQPCKENWRAEVGLTKEKIMKWSCAAPMDQFSFVKSTVKSHKKINEKINADFPSNGSKPKNIKAAAFLLREIGMNLEVLECPFLTMKFADYAANKTKGTNNYIDGAMVMTK